MKLSLCGCTPGKNNLNNIKYEASTLSRDIIEHPEKYKNYLSETLLRKIKNLNPVEKHALRQEVKIQVTHNETPKMQRYLKTELKKIKSHPSKILEDKKMIEYVRLNKSQFVNKVISSDMKTTEDQKMSNSFFAFLKSLWKEVATIVDIVLEILVDIGTTALKASIGNYDSGKYKKQIERAIDHIGSKINLIDDRITKKIEQEEFENNNAIEDSRVINNLKNDYIDDVFTLGELE